jgi:hypothetical protein
VQLLDVHRGLPQAPRVPGTVVIHGAAAERDHGDRCHVDRRCGEHGSPWPWASSWIRSWRAIAGPALIPRLERRGGGEGRTDTGPADKQPSGIGYELLG